MTPGGAAPFFSPQDTQDPNPLIRALAVRTMGCIRVDKIVEYLCEPLRKCLKDEDPYVRKTAAVCVAKLYDINGELVEDQGFLDMVYDLLGDSNPMVVSNAVAALAEISETSETAQRVFQINTSTLQKMLAALNECTEWGQVFILDSLALYNPAAASEAESIIERVTPRLQHANSAVVLSAIKVMIKYMDLITSQETLKALYKKMAPPLVTLLSSEPEIQYVALRNINLIVQKRPTILAHEIKVFFCKYNDPIYVKMEKLEIMIKLASERNVDQARTHIHMHAHAHAHAHACRCKNRVYSRLHLIPALTLPLPLPLSRCSWSSRSTRPRWTSSSCAAPCAPSAGAPSSSSARRSAASTCCSSSSRQRSTTWCRRPSSSSRTSSASSPTGALHPLNPYPSPNPNPYPNPNPNPSSKPQP